MPKGTKVHKVFEALKQKGHSVKSAAKIAQKLTGRSLRTGRKPKTRKP